MKNIIYSFNQLTRYWDKLSGIWLTFPFSYSKMKEFHKIEEKSVLSLINNKNSTVLDLGCGTGRILEPLNKKGCAKLYGLDISSEMLKICKSHLSNSTILLQHDFRIRLPFQSNSFDFVIATANTLISGIENPKKILKDIYRILKKNGKLIAGIYNADYLTGNLVEKYYKKFPKDKILGFVKFDNKRKIVYFGGLYSRWMTEKEIIELFNNSGFHKIKIKREGIGFIVIAKK